jgi:ABC-type antimicrobial peptide transport system permease subunit
MRLIFFLLVRGWAGHRLRTALTVLGVALGVAVVSAILVMDHNTVQSRLHDGRAMSGAADFELLTMDPTRAPKEVRERLTKDGDIAAVHLLLRAEPRASSRRSTRSATRATTCVDFVRRSSSPSWAG